MQLPPQPLRGLLPILLHGEQRHDGCEQFSETVTRQRRDCDLNPGPSAPESSTLTTRLPSHCYITTHTHTHPFNGSLSGTTRVSRYQKGKTNLDFTGARDTEWQWHQLGMCKTAPRSRQITTPAPHHSVFYRPDALPAAQPTASKHGYIADSSIVFNMH